ISGAGHSRRLLVICIYSHYRAVRRAAGSLPVWCSRTRNADLSGQAWFAGIDAGLSLGGFLDYLAKDHVCSGPRSPSATQCLQVEHARERNCRKFFNRIELLLDIAIRTLE